MGVTFRIDRTHNFSLSKPLGAPPRPTKWFRCVVEWFGATPERSLGFVELLGAHLELLQLVLDVLRDELLTESRGGYLIVWPRVLHPRKF